MGNLRVSRFLGEARLPHAMPFRNTAVGGLSGVDRDPHTDVWYLISDDRSDINPIRFYTAQLDFGHRDGLLREVAITGVTTIRRPDGTEFPSFQAGAEPTADPEAIRFDPLTGTLLWASEGECGPEISGVCAVDPFVRRMATDGQHLTELPIPDDHRSGLGDQGPRRNLLFEGLAVGGAAIAAIAEGPIYADGEPPTVQHGGLCRITRWGHATEALQDQYAYELDAVPWPSTSPTGMATNGAAEILGIDENRYLVLERAYAYGVGNSIRVYEVDCREATDVLGWPSVANGKPHRTVNKRLLLELDASRLPEYLRTVENIEGMSFGPRLDTGEDTLVLVSDDNFRPDRSTQFLAFALTDET